MDGKDIVMIMIGANIIVELLFKIPLIQAIVNIVAVLIVIA